MSWEDYDSIQMFPGCDCPHNAISHKAAWGDWRDGHGCTEPDCPCDIEWEHT